MTGRGREMSSHHGGRLAEIRRLLDDGLLRDRGVLVAPASTVTAYEERADSYDEEAGGGLFEMDEPVVADCLDGREPGVALDAACGTGRFASFLAGHGYRVIGVGRAEPRLAGSAVRGAGPAGSRSSTTANR